jgi:Mrp family chromosome partitioning ATPase
MMPVSGTTTVLSMLSASTRLDRTSVFVNLATLEMAGNVKVGIWDNDTKKIRHDKKIHT